MQRIREKGHRVIYQCECGREVRVTHEQDAKMCAGEDVDVACVECNRDENGKIIPRASVESEPGAGVQ